MSAKPPDEPPIRPRFSRPRESRPPRLPVLSRLRPRSKSVPTAAVRSAGVRFAGRHAQRVIVRARIVSVRGKSPADAMRRYLAYLARDGADRQGGSGRVFGAGGELEIERFTRDLMRRMQHHVGSPLDYVACAHHDTDQPHVHRWPRRFNARGHL